VATKFAFLIGKRGTILAIASVIAALLGAETDGFFRIDGFWDGPH
jgi:hypothetical protein